MKKNFSDYIVALVVVACSGVLLAALTFALSGYRLKKPTRTLQIDYRDIAGIHIASELRFAGAPAGQVTAIRVLTAAERDAGLDKGNAVRVTVAINEGVPPFPGDAAASINSDTLLADKFIAMSAGTPDSPALANGAILQGEPNGMNQIMQGAGPLIQKLDALLGTLQVDLKDLMPKLGTVLDSAQSAVKAGQSLLTNANLLVGEKGSLSQTLDQMKEAVIKLKTVEADLDDVLKKAGGFVGTADHEVSARMKELGVALQNLKVATTYMKAFTKSIAEKPNRVLFSGKPEKLQSEEAILKSSQPIPAKP